MHGPLDVKIMLIFPCTGKTPHGTQQNPISCPLKQNMQAVCCHSWQVQHHHIPSFTNSYDLVWELVMSVWKMALFVATVVRWAAIIRKIVTAYVFCCYWWDCVFGTRTAVAPKHIHSPTELNGTGEDVFHKGQVARALHYNLLPFSAKVKDASHLPHSHIYLNIIMTWYLGRGKFTFLLLLKRPLIWGQGCSALVLQMWV
jgi:hypothetical protein